MSEQTLNLVNNIVINAEKHGVAKLVLDNQNYDGKHVVYNGKTLISFGSYSYLGLEVDDRLKEGAIEAIKNYGIQYPSSRIYSSLPIYQTLNSLMEEIFGSNVVLTTSLSLGHMGVMPVVIEKNDILILDQHVHSSIQDAAQRLKAKNIPVTILRHNDLHKLEKNIIEYSKQYNKVWYAIDGIYSMYGDTAPIKELEVLLNKYPKFHIYADDAHGVSSFGQNGSGWILGEIKLHSKLILSTGMAKAFGTMGGVFVIPNNVQYEKVKNCTGSLIFSGPHPIPIIGASIASARIHLSTEIIERQLNLQEKIRYCSELLRREGVPDISDKTTPIFFIAVGKISAGYRLAKKLINDGFLANIASFPAVSESCTGIRFTVNLNHSIEDIEQLVLSIKRNYLLVLKEEELSVESIRRAFRKVQKFPDWVIGDDISIKSELTCQLFRSIKDVPKEEKDCLLEVNSLFSSETLEFLEDVFSKKNQKEDQWSFYYLSIKDKKGKLLITTLFTAVLTKDDMLASSGISEQIEKDRKSNKYLLSSKTLMMGTLLSEGSQIWIDRNHNSIKRAIDLLLIECESIKELEKANVILFRDFEEKDSPLIDCLKQHGFLKILLPDGHRIERLNWNNQDEYLCSLPKKKRKYVRTKAIDTQEKFDVQIISSDYINLEKAYALYLQVVQSSFELNTFPLPLQLFKKLLSSEFWEQILLFLNNELVASMLCFKSTDSYTPVLVGLDYEYLSFDIYPQILWQTLKRAKELELSKVNLGYTASQNKRKFGAAKVERFCMVKSNDSYHQQLIEFY